MYNQFDYLCGYDQKLIHLLSGNFGKFYNVNPMAGSKIVPSGQPCLTVNKPLVQAVQIAPDLRKGQIALRNGLNLFLSFRDGALSGNLRKACRERHASTTALCRGRENRAYIRGNPS